MNLKLIAAIIVLAAVPALAQAQGKKATVADAQAVVKLIKADKGKVKTYCDISKLNDQIKEADKKKDTKKVDELSDKVDEMSKQWGPQYAALQAGMEGMPAETKEAQAIGDALGELDDLCGRSAAKRRDRVRRLPLLSSPIGRRGHRGGGYMAIVGQTRGRALELALASLNPMRNALAIVAVLALTAAGGPAYATAEYNYKANEYVIVDHGLAPNNKFSIAAHGTGEGGSEEFHLYVMAEPEHRPLAPASIDRLEIHFIWIPARRLFIARSTANSGHVAIMFRADRHILIMVLYALRDSQPHHLKGPTLFGAVTKSMPESSDDYAISSRTSAS